MLRGNLAICPCPAARNSRADLKRDDASPADSSQRRARAPEALFPARNDVPVIDVVGDATLKRGHLRSRGPGHALPQLTSLGVRGRVRREQHVLAELAQG